MTYSRRCTRHAFAKMVALAAVATALLRSTPVAAAMPLPEDFVSWTPYSSYWLENNPAWLPDHVHDAGSEVLPVELVGKNPAGSPETVHS